MIVRLKMSKASSGEAGGNLCQRVKLCLEKEVAACTVSPRSLKLSCFRRSEVCLQLQAIKKLNNVFLCLTVISLKNIFLNS